MIVRQTTLQEARRVAELFAIAFEQPMSNGPSEEPNPRFHPWASFLDDDLHMMSTLGISDYQIQFDGHSCKMGGIGGVASLPQYRRLGGVRGIFEAILPHMYENGYDFSYLYPFSTNYYRKFGYECCVQKYGVSALLSLLNPPAVSGSFRLAEPEDPMVSAIQKLDSIWESRYNMTVIHSDEDYDWAKKADPAVKQEFTYVYFDAASEPKAYTTFKMVMQDDGRNLVCSRFCFHDREGFYGLMHLFKSLSSDHRYVKFQVPTSSGMQYLMPEWSLGAAQWAVHPAGMVRVINVENALKKARYIGSGSAVLEIVDEQISQNNGRFAVSFTDGRAVSVEKTNSSPNMTLTIPAFSALIAGVCDFDSAVQWFHGLTVHRENPALGQIFFRKDMMITDYF